MRGPGEGTEVSGMENCRGEYERTGEVREANGRICLNSGKVRRLGTKKQ